MALTKCKECGKEVSTRAKTCPNCGSPVKSRPLVGCLIIILSIAFIGIITSLFYGNKSDKTHNSGPGTKSSPSISLGEVGILSGSSGTHTLVAVTEEVLDQFIKARVAKDEYGEALILGSDLVFLVKNGTKVRVIEYGKGIFKRKIRILEGEMKDRAGYVPYEWVKPL